MLKREFSFVLRKKVGIYEESKTIDLNNYKAAGFAINPTGFGMNADFDMLRIGNNNIVNIYNLDLPQIGLEIVFKSYDAFNNFAKKMAWGNYQAELVYKVPLNGQLEEFRRKVAIVNITKGEIVNGYLSSQITMTPKSFWYKDNYREISLVADTQRIIDIDAASDLPREIIFNVTKGQSLTVSYSAAYSGNQKLKLKNLNASELNSYTKISYSSESGEAYINAINSSGTLKKDLLNSKFVDFTYTTTPFIKMVAGESGYLRFTNDVDSTLELTIRDFYIMV